MRSLLRMSIVAALALCAFCGCSNGGGVGIVQEAGDAGAEELVAGDAGDVGREVQDAMETKVPEV